MKLYNTLSKKVEDIVPIHDKKINMFVCGPTVYDYSHLGHAKTYTQLDVLARTLRAAGYETFYLQNITDIDDKILVRALENNVSWEQLRTQYEDEYKKDMETLNNTSVTQYARATDYINDIIRQVQTLLAKGHAYAIQDGIYFEIKTFPEYGKLSGRQEVQENDAQTRIDHSDEKRGWNDFCLWKFSKPGEPEWDSPFGKGRPGWHIEDTAITEHFFGPQYDIHGGAIDLIFPHHEAEITQMESASEKKPFVRYWVHTGFLNIDDTKMSKSLKNFFTIREVLEKGYDPMAIRLLMIQPHYRSSVNFSWENLDASHNALQNFRAWADLQFQDLQSTRLEANYKEATTAILDELENDLSTPSALAYVNGMINRVEELGIDSAAIASASKIVDDYFGLGLANRLDITDEQKTLIAERSKARDAKDWAKSDELRNQLLAQGIGLRDTPQGAIWYRP